MVEEDIEEDIEEDMDIDIEVDIAVAAVAFGGSRARLALCLQAHSL